LLHPETVVFTTNYLKIEVSFLYLLICVITLVSSSSIGVSAMSGAKTNEYNYSYVDANILTVFISQFHSVISLFILCIM